MPNNSAKPGLARVLNWASAHGLWAVSASYTRGLLVAEYRLTEVTLYLQNL